MKIGNEIKERSISGDTRQKEDYYEYMKESKEELVEEITKRIIYEIKREKNNVINNIYVKEIEEEEEADEEVIDNKIEWAPLIVVVLIGMFFLFILVYFTSNNEITGNAKMSSSNVEKKVVLVTPVNESMEEVEVEHSNIIESLFSFADNSNDIQSIDFKAFEKSVKKNIIDILDKVKESLE